MRSCHATAAKDVCTRKWIPKGVPIGHKSAELPTFMNSARALAPSMGMELYTEARMPPTERCPFN